MKDVIRMFLFLVSVFWLVVAHCIAIHLIDINKEAAIVTGVILAHLDMFLIAMFVEGYKKTKEEPESEGEKDEL